MHPDKRQRLIASVRRLDALLAERAALDERIAAAESEIDDITEAAEDAVVVEDDGEGDLPSADTNASRILGMVAQGDFSIYAAAKAIYGNTDGVSRKKVRSSLSYLEGRNLIARTGEDEWTTTATYNRIAIGMSPKFSSD